MSDHGCIYTDNLDDPHLKRWRCQKCKKECELCNERIDANNYMLYSLCCGAYVDEIDEDEEKTVKELIDDIKALLGVLEQYLREE